jgi:hypothetical protein
MINERHDAFPARSREDCRLTWLVALQHIPHRGRSSRSFSLKRADNGPESRRSLELLEKTVFPFASCGCDQYLGDASIT